MEISDILEGSEEISSGFGDESVGNNLIIDGEPDLDWLSLPYTSRATVTLQIQSYFRELFNFFQRQVRNRAYFYTTVHRARSAALKELNFIDEPRLDEIEYYIEILEKAMEG